MHGCLSAPRRPVQVHGLQPVGTFHEVLLLANMLRINTRPPGLHMSVRAKPPPHFLAHLKPVPPVRLDVPSLKAEGGCGAAPGPPCAPDLSVPNAPRGETPCSLPRSAARSTAHVRANSDRSCVPALRRLGTASLPAPLDPASPARQERHEPRD